MTTRSFRCKGILFDLDGVLVDSAECVARTWRTWATRHRLDPEAVISIAHGRPTAETVRLAAPGLSAEAEVASLDEGLEFTSEGIREIEGARQLLERLPPSKWAVVTSGTRAIAEFRMRCTGLPSPSVLISADEIARGKPDPEGYLTAAARLRLTADDCIVIEDAPPGIDAARAARMPVIAIASTYPRERLSGADAVVDRLSDLSVLPNNDELDVQIAR